MDEVVVIIGAGPAGLCAAYALQRWGLRLNTHHRYSGQPGRPIPRQIGAFPTRDQYVAYLVDYAADLGLPISFGVRATRIERTDGGGWLVHTDQGTVRRRHAIVVTGSDRAPHLPAWPGRDHFLGELIHAGAFRHANDYMDRRVPIVGAGNSAFDIGNYLSRVPLGPSWISVHRGPTVAPQTLWGIPTHPCWSGPADSRSGPRIA